VSGHKEMEAKRTDVLKPGENFPVEDTHVHVEMRSSRFKDAHPGTLVVTRRVKASHEREYQDWLERILSATEQHDGFKDQQVYPPADGHHDYWTVVIHFETMLHAKAWRSSNVCQAFMKEVDEMTIDSEINLTYMDVVSSIVWGIDAVEHLSSADNESIKDFGEAPNKSPGPVPWKNAFAVLTTLYPTAMLAALIFEFWWRAQPSIPGPFRMLVQIQVCVALLVKYLVPYYMKHMAWWVFSRSTPLQTELCVIAATMVWWGTWMIIFMFSWPHADLCDDDDE